MRFAFIDVMWRRLRTRCECYVACFAYPEVVSALGFSCTQRIANSKTKACYLRDLMRSGPVVGRTEVRAFNASSSTRGSRLGVGESLV